MEKEDIVFRCSKCRQWLEAPPDTIGLFVECPKCSEIIKVPAASENPDQPADDSGFRAPPPAPPPEAGDGKGSTVRIELPPDAAIPSPPPRRKFILRRPS